MCHGIYIILEGKKSHADDVKVSKTHKACIKYETLGFNLDYLYIEI